MANPLIHNTLHIVSGSVFANLLLAASNFIMARFLGAASYGQVALAININVFFLILFEFGICSATTREISNAVARDDREAASGIVSSSLFLMLSLGIIAAALLIILSCLLASRFYGPEIRILLLWSSCWVVLIYLFRCLGAVYDGYQIMVYSALNFFLYEPLRFFAIVIALIVWSSPLSVIVSINIGYAAGSILLVLVFISFCIKNNVRVRLISLKKTLLLVTSGLTLYLPTIGPFITLPLVVMLIGTVLSKTDVALFSVAYSLTSLGYLVFFPVSRAIYPFFVHSYTKNKWEAIRNVYAGLIKIIGFCGIVMLLLYSLAGKLILSFFGKDYTEAYPILMILALATVFEMFRILVNPLLNATDQARLTSKIELLKLVILIVLEIILINFLGITGAGVAVLLVYIIGIAFKFYFIGRSTKMHVRWSLVGYLLAALIIFTITYFGLARYYYFLLVPIGFLFRLLPFREIRSIINLSMGKNTDG